LQEEQELGDLFKRAAASSFVVVGQVTRDDVVGERGKRPSIDDNVVGILHTISISEVLCRQEELGGGRPTRLAQTPDTIRLFVPLKPIVEGRHLKKETPSAGRRYLLFLVVADPLQQKNWIDAFELDPQATYFRGEELSRGVIPLTDPTAQNPSPQQPPVLEKMRQLCSAMYPSRLDAKLSALHQLVASHDPILEKEAQIAINALEAQQ
jgi:hypothetical protein